MFSKFLLAMALVGVANAQTSCGNADGSSGAALVCLANSAADAGATGTLCTGTCTQVKDNDKCCTADAGYFSDATANANAVTQCSAVANAASGATLTCSSATTSQITACASGYTKNDSGNADVCDADCDASAAPTNGAVGDCTSTLASGNTCQPTCDAGYTVSGTTSCTAGKAIAATCSLPATTTTAAATTAAPSPSDDHDGHNYSPSPATVSAACTMPPASIVTLATMLVAYVMH